MMMSFGLFPLFLVLVHMFGNTYHKYSLEHNKTTVRIPLCVRRLKAMPSNKDISEDYRTLQETAEINFYELAAHPIGLLQRTQFHSSNHFRSMTYERHFAAAWGVHFMDTVFDNFCYSLERKSDRAIRNSSHVLSASIFSIYGGVAAEYTLLR